MKTKTIYRNAVTGDIVTAQYAKANPDTTVKETMKVVPKKAIETLRKYQEWRQGKVEASLHPTTITKAINEILNYFEQ
jgi:hypothetical protein